MQRSDEQIAFPLHQSSHQDERPFREQNSPVPQSALLSHVPDPALSTLLQGRGQEQQRIAEPANEEKGAGVTRVKKGSNELRIRGGGENGEMSLFERRQKLDRNVKLTPRDMDLLIWIAEMKFLTIGLARKIFFGGTVQLAHRRLTLLKNAGYLRSENVRGSLGHTMVFRVAYRTLQMLQECGLPVPAQKRKLAASFLNHDLLVSEVRSGLSKFWDFKWKAEVFLKSDEGAEIPDGLCFFKSSEFIAAVEVESTIKSKARYDVLFRRWQYQANLLVLYVATQDSVFRGLQSLLSAHPGHLPIGLLHIRDLDLPSPIAWSSQGELDIFSRRTLE